MRSWICSLALASIIQLLGIAAPLHASTVLVVNGIKKTGGTLKIAIDSSAASFAEKTEPLKTISVPVEQTANDSIRIDLGDFEPGTYAVRVFHDVNSNGELDTNFVGIPKEQFGFSNNPRIAFGPPSFTDSAVSISGSSEISVEMKTF